MNELTVFRCGAQQFAVPSVDVMRRSRRGEAVPVPRAPVWLCGAAYVAGRVLAVVDVDALLGGAVAARSEWLVVRTAEGPLVLGVDSVAFARGELEAGDGTLCSQWAKIGAERLAVLSLEKLGAKIRLAKS